LWSALEPGEQGEDVAAARERGLRVTHGGRFWHLRDRSTRVGRCPCFSGCMPLKAASQHRPWQAGVDRAKLIHQVV
jgi:hypothetical protein